MIIRTITLPVPWDLKSVNVHLVELDEGFMLIDSGVANPECFEVLDAAIAGCGVKWSDVRTLLLTHYHPDHIGQSWKILELTGAKLIMHRADVAYLAELARANGVPGYSHALRIAGVPTEFGEEIERSLRGNRPAFRTHRPDQVLEGGETLPVRGGTLEVIWTPGHTPGHVCLYSKETRTLISGDHVLQKITPNIAWHPNEDMLAQFLDSLELLRPYDVDVVLPSHGSPFEGHRATISGIAGHHEERCATILENLARQPMTAHELVTAMWRRKLSPFHHHFAVFEILAHLEYMSRRGQVSGGTDDRHPTRWEPAA